MIFENIANILAMIFSLVAIIMLIVKSLKIGGSVGKMLKFIVAGIFFAVFVHSAFELLASYNLINETTLLPVMGTLLTIGSICFILGAYFGKTEF